MVVKLQPGEPSHVDFFGFAGDCTDHRSLKRILERPTPTPFAQRELRPR